MLDEVDEQTFDVTSVMVLIGHDHNPAIPQRLKIFVNAVVNV